MTYSFQVIVNTDEEMGTVLSALFGGLITLGKERNELKKQLEFQQKRVVSVEVPLKVETAKQVLQKEGYVFYKKPAGLGKRKK